MPSNTEAPFLLTNALWLQPRDMAHNNMKIPTHNIDFAITSTDSKWFINLFWQGRPFYCFPRINVCIVNLELHPFQDLKPQTSAHRPLHWNQSNLLSIQKPYSPIYQSLDHKFDPWEQKRMAITTLLSQEASHQELLHHKMPCLFPCLQFYANSPLQDPKPPLSLAQKGQSCCLLLHISSLQLPR
ncbi:hypothetical protein OIU84_010386 [Salix udensis]|uniref:Uncharacterized protein n=1 Tax=Salix udensis TaxID=889485 RepID=A0AAD6NVT5_9ROSI|nr:hypothetical protein OIU84_010386 [Salix udensis]